MAVAVAGQGVMTLVLGAVDGLLHRAEHRVVDRVLFRAALQLVQQALDLEAAFKAVGLDVQIQLMP